MIRKRNLYIFLLLFCSCQKDLLGQNSANLLDSLLSVLKTQKDDTSKVNLLNDLSSRFINISEYKKAKQYADSALVLADKLNCKKGKANTYNNIGNIHFHQNNYPEALKNYLTSLKIRKEIGDKRGIAASYNNLGLVYKDQGNYPEALNNHLASLKIKEEIGDKAAIPSSYNNIGNIYAALGNYKEALHNYKASLKIREEIGDKQGIAGSYSNIGAVYQVQGQNVEALKSHLASLKIREEFGDKQGIAVSYSNIGTIYSSQGNYTEAMKNDLASLKIRKEIGDKWGIASSYINIADDLSKQAIIENAQVSKLKYNEALQYLNKGLLLAKGIGVKDLIKEAYKSLAEVYKRMNDYKKALEYYDLYVDVKDSLMNNEVTRKLELQRTQYEVEKAVEGEKIKNQVTLAEQKAELKRKNELLFGGFTILAIITFLIALLIRQRNLKRRAVDKAEAGHKMAELELQSLRAQLNPHFMFNSLNAIQDLILKEDNDRSHLYLSRFSKLLRMLLDNANQPFVSVKQEMEFLELYLSLENLRIPNLKFSIEKDPKLNTEERMIPNMMLQPYIENAIWHGLSNKKGERKLQIRIHENSSATEFEIEDNGIGRNKAAELKQQFRHGHHSKGMQLLSKRFELLSKEYGSSIETTVTDLQNNGDATGTLVKIDVPFTLSEQAKQLVNDTNDNN